MSEALNRIAWLATGERCPASNTLYDFALADFTSGIPAYPRTAEDLRRCRLLLEKAPALKENLQRVAKAGPEWAQFASFWDDLCLVQDIESPNWRKAVRADKNTNMMIDSFIEASTASKGERNA